LKRIDLVMTSWIKKYIKDRAAAEIEIGNMGIMPE
jgi:hypothetical protein